MASSMQALKLQGCRGEAVVVSQSPSLNEAGARKDAQHDGGHGSIPETTSKSKGKEKEICLDLVNEQVLATVHDVENGGKDSSAVVSGERDTKELEAVLTNTALNDKETAEEWTCAICLDTISEEELSLIKGCGHAYCTHCILKWAAFKSEKQSRTQSEDVDPLCPTCKHPFNTLVTARALDGTVKPHLEEESLALLLRALWFAEGTSVSQLGFATPDRVNAEAFESYDQDDDDLYEYDDDDYYVMNSRISRKVISNRKFGAGGILQAGRMQARPVGHSYGSSHKTKANGNKNAAPGKKAQGPSSSGSPGEGGAKPVGRRAKRNAKRRQSNAV